MLYYGLMFYLLGFVLIFNIILFGVYVLNSAFVNKFVNFQNMLALLLAVFFIFFFIILNVIFLIFQSMYTSFDSITFFHVISFWNYGNMTHLTLLGVYYFPFLFIFLLITVLSIVFCLSYNLNELISFAGYTTLILIAGSLLFFTDSLILFFFAYEMLLIPSFFILYKFAKTRRSVEAAYLMFFWTQFGALFLIFSFLYVFFLTNSTNYSAIALYKFSPFEINFLFACWLVGFGVKLPIWPFYNWLPKAHVEASTNFSIFLSGVLVKFAFFGFFKCLLTLELEPSFVVVFPFLLIGLTDSVFKLFYQIDLKKLIAYSTVVEMHWLTLCVISGQSCLLLANFCMLISHALLSTNSFLLVDAINRRFKTRLITEISGLNFFCPKLFLMCLINCLVFLGFPGSLFFIAEVLFFSFCFDLFPLLAVFLLILLYFFNSVFFFKNWTNVMFGFSRYSRTTIPADFTKKEFLICGGLVVLAYWLGFNWQSFLL